VPSINFVPLTNPDVLNGLDVTRVNGSKEYIVNDGDHCIALLSVMETPESHEPHLQYFPWATVKHKYWAVPAVIDFLRQTKHVIISTRFYKCFDRWAKRGKIRKVGFLDEMSCGTVHIYQAVKCSTQ